MYPLDVEATLVRVAKERNFPNQFNLRLGKWQSASENGIDLSDYVDSAFSRAV